LPPDTVRIARGTIHPDPRDSQRWQYRSDWTASSAIDEEEEEEKQEERKKKKKKKKEDHLFEYAIIGKGMFGSAAAKYLADHSDSILLIGSDEPQDLRLHKGVFGSYYDSGRITRILDTEYVWALAAKRSIDRYRQIENDGGESFFHPVGCLRVMPDAINRRQYIAANEAIGDRLQATYERLSDDDLNRRWRYLRFPKNSLAIFETKNAGWIDPRKLVKAQQQIAAAKTDKGSHPCVQIIGETVVGKNILADGSIELKTDKANRFNAKRILVTAGGFANFNGLIERRLNLMPRAETTLRAEISQECAVNLKEMPCLIWFFDDHPNLHYVYIVPPVQYPDGRWYLKVGGDREAEHLFTCLAELETWFHSDGGAEAASDFRGILESLIPDMEALSWVSKPCVITDTATDRPYIGAIDENVFVAVGGCGAAAKSSDEFGRLAALCVRGEQDLSYGADAFHVLYEGEEDSGTRRQFHF